jgi:hypothetical protein
MERKHGLGIKAWRALIIHWLRQNEFTLIESNIINKGAGRNAMNQPTDR